MKLLTRNNNKSCQDFRWKVTSFSRNRPEARKPTPRQVDQILDHLETWHTYTGGANILFHSKNPYRPWFLAIRTQSDLDRTP